MRKPRRWAIDLRAAARFLIRSTRRLVITLVGSVLVCLGLAGLLLPVLPGWLLIIAGFAVLSREYSWAHSCLAFCRRQATRSGSKIRTMALRRRTQARAGREVVLPSDDMVIDLTAAQSEAVVLAEPATESRSSQAL